MNEQELLKIVTTYFEDLISLLSDKKEAIFMASKIKS